MLPVAKPLLIAFAIFAVPLLMPLFTGTSDLDSFFGFPVPYFLAILVPAAAIVLLVMVAGNSSTDDAEQDEGLGQ